MTVTVQKFSLQEYLDYETVGRYELVDGEIFPMAQGTGKHGGIIEYLNEQFKAVIQFSDRPWTSKDMKIAIQSPRGTRWETARVPDVVVLSLEQWDAMEDCEAFIPLNEPPPFLVVEVVSPSTIATDYRTKHSEYAVLDISEYWIVDPLELKITTCTLEDGAYRDRIFQPDESIFSPTFPELNLTVTQILNRGRIA